ncbi:MAG: hypothetical protein JNM72_00860 [Deltaproteobacteria bacterium]|nr:hypothetical protein [Deltaproteobacteria bacterium]
MTAARTFCLACLLAAGASCGEPLPVCERYARAVDACLAELGNTAGPAGNGGETCRAYTKTGEQLVYYDCVTDAIEPFDCSEASLVELALRTAACHPLGPDPDLADAVER